MRKGFTILFVVAATLLLSAQQVVRVGSGSYAAYAPLSESQNDLHGGCHAYQTEHRTLYLADSLLDRLSSADGTKQGTLSIPSNDWWTYGVVNKWTGKLWNYPGWVEAKSGGIDVGYPTYWEPTGCEMKWDTPLHIDLVGLKPTHKVIDSWSDYSMSFVMAEGDQWVRTVCVHGSPLVWLEAEGLDLKVTNPDEKNYAVYTYKQGTRTYVTVALLTAGLSKDDMEPYAFRIPETTRIDYQYVADKSELKTVFSVSYRDIKSTSAQGVIQGFIPHHYQGTSFSGGTSIADGSGYAKYATPRGEMRISRGNRFEITYKVHGMLPYFPAPAEDLEGYDKERMHYLITDYAQKGSFGADTYWGGKGLVQMMHYMTFALQMGDKENYLLAKRRLKEYMINWFTYTPGEKQYYFAKFPRWGALVGFDPSYDSDTFNDHHFHYGYFVYSAAVLCMLDEEFKREYGPMARELARDYANWRRDDADEPWFRTLDPYCGHSFAGGMGNEGNGNGQESSSESMQGWGGVWMLGAALGDKELLEAGIFGYTLEARGTAEYWFDRGRRNIDYSKYKHPWCCNLTMQGVGWWTWFSGDPVWMHSIQWMPISPVLTNYLSEDLDFNRWDYGEMYKNKEVKDYEAATGGLGDESGLGNVCLSYLALFDADSAARVYDRLWTMGKALAKNPDTGGITYWLTHSHRTLGDKRYDIFANDPLATAYTKNGKTTFAVYNTSETEKTVKFFGAENKSVNAAPMTLTLVCDGEVKTVEPIEEEKEEEPDYKPEFPYAYPNIALHKPVTASSEENAGTLKESATDGDLTTRWGSQHRDNEWMMVDLKERCYIDEVVIYWEAAYASRFELAISEDKQTWSTIVGNGTHGKTTTKVQLIGRYIRLTGLERATTYGTSLYELEAYGLPLDSDSKALFGLVIETEDEFLYSGEEPSYRVVGYDVKGRDVAVSPAITKTVTLDSYTIKATVGSIMTAYTWPVMEKIEITSVKIDPKTISVPLGEIFTFRVSATDQFGYEMDWMTLDYEAKELGTHDVIGTMYEKNDTAKVTVLDFAEMNLALGKNASCSGTENEAVNGADKAVDGKNDTRWSSRFQDNEWLEVNLGSCYKINKVRLLWEAAYATSYEILVSQDAVEYSKVYETDKSQGKTEVLTFDETPARYVRILCRKRSTGYGSSLFEMEVYGVGRCDRQETDLFENQLLPDSQKFIKDQQLYIRLGENVYNAVGVRVQ